MRNADAQSALVARLAVLTPATILALQRIPFDVRMRALPGVVSASDSIHDVQLIEQDALEEDEEPEEIEVARLVPATFVCEERMIVLDRYVVVGGLIHDDDARHLDPCQEGQCNGRILHAEDRDERREMYAAIGRDSDGNMLLDDDHVLPALVTPVWHHVAGDLHTLMSLSRQYKLRNPEGTLEDALRTAVLDGATERNFAAVLEGIGNDLSAIYADLGKVADAHRGEAYQAALAAGDIGEPLAVRVDIYEHGGRCYSLGGEGTQCQFDTSRGGAMWIPCDFARENIFSMVCHKQGLGRVRWYVVPETNLKEKYAQYSLDGAAWLGGFPTLIDAVQALQEASPVKVAAETLRAEFRTAAREYARGIVEEYSAWASGEVYIAGVYVIDRKTGRRIKKRDNHAHGCIGTEYAVESLEEIIAETVTELTETQH